MNINLKHIILIILTLILNSNISVKAEINFNNSQRVTTFESILDFAVERIEAGEKTEIWIYCYDHSDQVFVLFTNRADISNLEKQFQRKINPPVQFIEPLTILKI